MQKLMVAGVLGAGLLVAGCGEAEVAKADVEKSAMDILTKKVGQPCPQITCPSGLKAKAGQKLTCGIALDGKTHDVTITATAVEGTNVSYEVSVNDTPRP
jgi:hypothetical protein